MSISQLKILIPFILLCSSSVFAQGYNQGYNQRGRNYSIVPRSDTTPDTKKQEEEFHERLENHIQSFMITLDIDDFQKHIIKQKLDSYFVEKLSILKSGIQNQFALEERIELLDNTHFNDIKEMTPLNIQDSIQKFIKIKEIAPIKSKKEKRKKNKDD